MKIALALLLSFVLLALQSSSGVGAYQPGDMIVPQQFGAVGNGIADDTVALQNAISTAQGSGKGIYLGIHRYKITAELLVSLPLTIVGVGKRGGTYWTNCPAGLSTIVVGTNINALTFLSDVHGGVVEGVCFEMASAPGVRTSGWAIKSNRGQATIRDNTIVYPYRGIVVTGETLSGQNNGSVLVDNLIVSPSNAAIVIGSDSQNANTPGITLRNNQIVCFATKAGTAGTLNAIGLLVYDGAVSAQMTDNGPYGCDKGTALMPGANQAVSGHFTGVIGDTSKSANLYIGPTHSTGRVSGAGFYGFWVSSAFPSSTTDRGVLIENPSGGTVDKLVFSAGMVHSNYGQTVPAMAIGGAGNVLVNGVQFIGNGSESVPGAAVQITGSYDVSVQGSFITPDHQLGIQLVGTANNQISVLGNTNLGGFPYNIPTPPTTMSILGNSGTSRNCPDLNMTVGTTVYTLTDAYDCYKTAGAGGDLWIMNGYWSSREVMIYAGITTLIHHNVGFNGLCGADISLAAGGSVKLTYVGQDSCWMRN